jgi:hypothetical protein
MDNLYCLGSVVNGPANIENCLGEPGVWCSSKSLYRPSGSAKGLRNHQKSGDSSEESEFLSLFYVISSRALLAEFSCNPLKFQGVFLIEMAGRDKLSSFPFAVYQATHP